MATPVPAGTAPLGITLEAGKTYWWCSCGLSKSQPWCDGSHKGSGLAPCKTAVQQSGECWLCTCKATKTPPFCDGSHKGVKQ